MPVTSFFFCCSLPLQVFYLIDFCYFVNIVTAVFLVWFPNNAQLEALVYALADGPIAGALVAWQCPWVFGSGEHTVR
jgi:pheromone shutdown protein TraB